MTNGEDLPPAWIDDQDDGRTASTHDVCRECDMPIVTADGPYCNECRPSRYFTMG